jgi:hypothetical protein
VYRIAPTMTLGAPSLRRHEAMAGFVGHIIVVLALSSDRSKGEGGGSSPPYSHKTLWEMEVKCR